MKRGITSVIAIFLALTVMTGVFAVGFYYGTKDNRRSLSSGTTGHDGRNGLGLIDEVYTIITKEYVDKEGKGKLVDGAVNGMIKSLGDPYTRRLKGEHYKFLEEQTSGKFGGVGIVLGSDKDGRIKVVEPIKDSPAARAGIKTDDLIVKVDGKSTEKMTVGAAAKLIRGDEGTKVTLTIERKGEKTFDAPLVREQIKVPNTSGKMIKDEIGLINLHQFSDRSGDEIKQELDNLKKKGAKGIILDLRSNPGGLLDEAVTVSSVFIESGKPIVSTKPRVGDLDVRLATGGSGYADTKIPLVVLVDKNSASASEIVAGAIQDYKRGAVVGGTTFGKGSVQTVITLSDGSGLVITTAKYLTPKGRSISKKGVKPDVVVKLDKGAHPGNENDNQLNKAADVLHDLIAGKKFKKAS